MVYSGWATLAPRTLRGTVTPGQSLGDESATQFLPLFPLGIVAFPGELVLLHIFEPRYRQLISECAERGITFGIVTTVSGGVSSIGTEMKLDRILRTEQSGNMNVAVRGLRAFQIRRVQRVVEGKLYSGGLVSFITNDSSIDQEVQSALVQLYNHMQYLSGSNQKIVAPYPDDLSFVVAHDVGMSQAQELQLLTMPAESERQAYLLQHLLRTQ